jgi:lipopolysaccharide transport protein LptA
VRRLRFLRVLLPLLLVVLGIVLWGSWKPHRVPHRLPSDVVESDAPRVEGLSFIDYGERIEGHAAVFEPHEDGSLHLEGIRDLELQREGRGPLLVSALRGDRRGGEGETYWTFEEEVVFREPDEGLQLSLSSLSIDDAAGEARSEGDIRFHAPNVDGTASSVLYGLNGQPGELTDPDFEDRQGGRMTAKLARLLDGIRDVELVGDVNVVQSDKELAAEKMRLIRGPADRLRKALASGEVRGSLSRLGEPDARLSSQEMDLRWDGEGNVEYLALNGEALLTRGDESLAARQIEAARDSAAVNPWRIDASEGVYVQGRFGGAPGLLRADHLQAWLDDSLGLREAEASGRVSFDGGDTRAEAERGTFHESAGRVGEIELYGTELRKARLAQTRTRVAALRIRELVEATLMPEREGKEIPARTRLFVNEQAIHFVSEKLDSLDTGRHLTFTGSVRGWQGERNLAAGRVVVDDRKHTLTATDAVSTRIPRESVGQAAAESHYVQIAADRLEYDDAQGQAIYVGHVRVRLVEGWLEAQRVEVLLSLESREIHEIRASDAVRIEFHRTDEGEMARPVSGTADRLVYTPAEATIRLFGEQTPAAVRRIGDGGGTTTGRVLRYQVDSGTLDVDSGDRGPGTIQG